ncbi:MAG: phosphoribosylamine--glycine ligase [Cyanobacteria bacterium]|nr:phosphoribosylamine--glycine ligase [Cyanobacteriota bacterium]
MRVLVVGNGGREHAIAWTLLQSPKVTRVYCIPGNGGTATLARCENANMRVDDFEGICRFAVTQGVAFAIIGPEAPLAAGLADELRSQSIPVFGPGRDGAQLEASKQWAKELMAQANIPTAASASFTDAAAAKAYVQQQGAPIVIKADGLASGKGVTVAMEIETAIAAIDESFSGKFGAAGQQVLIEEFMEGKEVSVLALTDGQTIRPLLPAQDHKRIGEGDQGPNTGGMGAYAPAPLATPALMERVQREILEPTVAALRDRGIDYCGVVYAGLMITPSGDPKVVEFNCRFGDPETQVVLPLLATPLHEVLQACIEKRLAALPPFAWKDAVAGCVVMAAGGYPGPFTKGQTIHGLDGLDGNGDRAIAFHAGTKRQSSAPNSPILTDGGRVLAVTSLGADFDDAFDRAYRAIAQIQFDGAYYRRDIANQVRSSVNLAPDRDGVAEDA